MRVKLLQEILSTSPMATQMSQLLSASSRYLQKTKVRTPCRL